MGKVAGKVISQRKHRSKLLLTTLGFLLGMTLLMISIQTYLDLQKLMQSPGGNTADYLIINKGVSAASTLGSLNKNFQGGFSEREIDHIAKQPFVHDLGKFSTSTFDVSSNLADRLSIYADLFFESVPDRFLDTVPPGWKWEEGDRHIPVLLNKEWLNVYNFNVSMMYGLPQLSEGNVAGLDFQVQLKGNGRQQQFDASIVAFSHRMPAITVPSSFLEYANQTFGRDKPPPSRLILQVKDASSEEVVHFLKDRGYQYNREMALPDGFKRIAQATFAISGIIGLLFFIFAFAIVLTTLQLSIADVSDELRLLIDLGYEPGRLSTIILKKALGYLIGATIVAGTLFAGVHWQLIAYLEESGFSISGAPYWTAMLAGLFLLLLVVTTLFISLKMSIRHVTGA